MLLYWFIALFLLFCLFKCARYAGTYLGQLSQLSTLPGPRFLDTVPHYCAIIGATPETASKKLNDYFKWIIDKYGGKQGLVRLWFPPYLMPLIIVSDGDIARSMLASDAFQEKGDLYSAVGSYILPNGLLVCDNTSNQETRRLLAPHLRLSSLNAYVPSILAHIQLFNSKIQKSINSTQAGVYTNVKPLISSLAYDIVTETLLGVNENAQETLPEGAEPKIPQAFDASLMYIDKLPFQPWKHLFRGWPFLQSLAFLLDWRPFSVVVPAIKEAFQLKKCINLLFQERMNVKADFTHKNVEQTEVLLDTILKREENEKPGNGYFNWAGLTWAHAETIELFFAGHSGICTTISWLLYFLAHHQTIQQALFEEISAFDDELVDYLSLKTLSHLDACIMETLRLAPIGSNLGRKSSHPFAIPGTSIVIPPGVNVVISALYINQAEKYFSQPARFAPERFLHNPESQLTAKQSVFVPFSFGKRRCFGERFGLLVIKIFFVRFLKQYQVKPMDTFGDVQPTHCLVQKAPNFPLQFIQRLSPTP